MPMSLLVFQLLVLAGMACVIGPFYLYHSAELNQVRRRMGLSPIRGLCWYASAVATFCLITMLIALVVHGALSLNGY